MGLGIARKIGAVPSATPYSCPQQRRVDCLRNQRRTCPARVYCIESEPFRMLSVAKEPRAELSNRLPGGGLRPEKTRVRGWRYPPD